MSSETGTDGKDNLRETPPFRSEKTTRAHSPMAEHREQVDGRLQTGLQRESHLNVVQGLVIIREVDFDFSATVAEQAVSMALFAYVAILGTVAAPIYSGFIDLKIGWRWIEGIQGLFNIPLLLALIFFFQETRDGVTLQRRASLLRKRLNDDRYKSPIDLETSSVKQLLDRSYVKAIHMLATEPVVFAVGLWIGFAWFITFVSELRGWNEGVAGLPYIFLVIGVSIGYAMHHLQMRHYNNLKIPTPEDRIFGIMYGAVWLPIGLFLYIFTQYGFLPWVAPTIALATIATGIFFIFESTYSYTGDCYGESASSAIAGQGLIRNTLGAVSLFASRFLHNVGSQYAKLISALISVAPSAIPFVMFRYGPTLRARSRLSKA